jgi:acyl phosphate:glycerol-3-phosphate acyltransferase
MSLLPLLLVAAAYLLGSIPFSFLVVKLFTGKDLRKLGSQNVGATNVARTAGKMPGIVALLLDGVKGWAAVALAQWLVSRPQWPYAAPVAGDILASREFWIALAGLVAVLAHMFPLWLRFHGGKGVATATGVFLALDPIVIAGALIVFAIVLLATRYVSLASMISAASIPLFFRFLVHDAPFWRIVVSILIALAVIMKHHSNISRLARGTERRMGERKDQ